MRSKLVRFGLPAAMVACVVVVLFWTRATAGEIYTVTSTGGGKTITYDVQMGRGKIHGCKTAFCPHQKKFVYLMWEIDREPEPKPVSSFWDHRTGETIYLYKFPDCPDPLPVIERIEDLKVCPFTGDKNLKVKQTGNWD